MKKLLLFLVLISICSCFKVGIRAKQIDPLYSFISPDSTDANKFGRFKKPILNYYDNFQNSLNEIVYAHFDESVDLKNDYVIIALFDSEKLYLFNINGEGKITKVLKEKSNGRNLLKLNKLILNLPNKYVIRDLLEYGGVTSYFFVNSNKTLKYYYSTIGASCLFRDKTNKMAESYSLLSIVFKLGNSQ
jgi:hypothetical protein